MFDRQLVASVVQRHLTALKWPLRPVIFHPNFGTAMDQLDAKNCSWDVTWWAEPLAAAVRLRPSELLELLDGGVTGWSGAIGIHWDTCQAWSDSRPFSSWPLAGYPGIEVARTFLEVLRGGAVLLWTKRKAVHVVLATIRTQERPPLHPGREHVLEDRLRLHCEDAPAIQYEDGSGRYFWKGIEVPERMILCPGGIRVEEILQERNAEVRRAMIERYGQDRFFLDAGAEQIDKWKDNELLSIDLPDGLDDRMVALKLRCPSTAAVYIIRVPPDQCTVQGALAWSFGLRPGQYFLQEES